MPRGGGFEPALPVSEQLQTPALDRAGHWDGFFFKSVNLKYIQLGTK